jgi:hypothetical protein
VRVLQPTQEALSDAKGPPPARRPPKTFASTVILVLAIALIGPFGIEAAHAAAPKVDVKWYGLDPAKYSHTTGSGGTSADGLRTELQAEDFECNDKVVFYALIDGSDLSGTNSTTVNLRFGDETTGNDPFGFSSGVSYALVGGDPNDTGNGNESLSGPGFSGGGSSDLLLSFTVGHVEGNEDIWLRVVTVLGNCGPGTASGNVLTGVDSASTVDSTGARVATGAGNQTVPLKFSGQLATGTLEVIKDLVPNTDPGTFDLRVDGTTYGTGGDGTDTGALTFLQGSYGVDEAGTAGTSLSDYTSSISCQNGGNPPAVVNGTSTTVTIAPGDAWVCTITNTRKAAPPPALSITVDKTNDANQTAPSTTASRPTPPVRTSSSRS